MKYVILGGFNPLMVITGGKIKFFKNLKKNPSRKVEFTTVYLLTCLPP